MNIYATYFVENTYCVSFLHVSFDDKWNKILFIEKS